MLPHSLESVHLPPREKALHLYRLMKKSDLFEWTPEAQVVFVELKALLSTQPVLAALKSQEPLLLYIAATCQVAAQSSSWSRKKRARLKKFSIQSNTFMKF